MQPQGDAVFPECDLPRQYRTMKALAGSGVPVPQNYFDYLPQGIVFGDSPLGGAHIFLIGGLHHLIEMSPDPAVRAKALQYGSILRGTVSGSAMMPR